MRFFRWKRKKVIKEFFLRTDLSSKLKSGFNIVPIELQIVKQSTTLSPAEKLVFEKIYFLSLILKESKGYCLAGNTKLAGDLGLHRNTINNCVKSLTKKGFIAKEIIEPGDVRNKSKDNNRYRKLTIVGGKKKLWIQIFTRVDI